MQERPQVRSRWQILLSRLLQDPRTRARQTAALAPGPEAHRLWGSLAAMRSDPVALFMDGFRRFGDVVRFPIGPRAAQMGSHLLSSPEHIKQVLQDKPAQYVKRGIKGFEKLRLVLGNGLLTSEGELWLRQRRTAQPAFSHERVASFGERMTHAATQIFPKWERAAGQEQPLDMAAEMSRLTLRVVGETLLGSDISGEADTVGQSLTTLMRHINLRATEFFSIPESIPTRANWRFTRARRALERVVGDTIAARRAHPEQAPDLLTTLMQARDPQSGAQMSDGQLRDEVLTFMLAGHETTANTLTWALYLLSLHPAVARQLADELHRVLGGRVPTVEDLPALPWTRAVIEETLRLYPPAWVIARFATCEDRIGSYAIPAYSAVLMSPYVVHRHPRYWDNPEGFDPERFLGGRSARLPRYAYFPFGGGPRQCIGNHFAMMEAQLILATLTGRFRVDLVPGYRAALEPTLTLRPRGGMPMVPKRVGQG